MLRVNAWDFDLWLNYFRPRHRISIFCKRLHLCYDFLGRSYWQRIYYRWWITAGDSSDAPAVSAVLFYFVNQMGKKVLIGVHLAYWFYILVIMEMVNSLAYKNSFINVDRVTNVLLVSNALLFAAIFYINYFLLLPRLFKKKKFLLLIVSWICLALLFVGLRFFIQEYLFMKWLGICNYCYPDYGSKWPVYVVNNFFQGLSNFILAGTVIWFADDWLRSEKQKIRLQKEKVDAERAFLQSQVSPHFLFNSLNNIYSMVYHGSPDSLNAIQKLSGMMRYVLSESQSVWIDLYRELTYLDDYIQLQRYRIRDAAIHYSITGDASGKVIAPLILISFVENAFKHGVVTDKGYPVVIRIEIIEDRLLFFTSNKISKASKDNTSGIGLSNVASRLSLQYPGLHTLAINEQDGIFEARLSINTLKAQSI